MKKLFALLTLVPLAASAQQLTPVAPGTFELGSSTNLSVLSSNVEAKAGGVTSSADETTWNVRGTGLYYVAPNIGVGGMLSYTSTKIGFEGTDVKFDTLAIGPAAGMTFPVAPQVDLFGRASIAYVSQEMGAGGTSITTTGWGFGLEAGLKYFVVKSVSLDGSLLFQYQSLTSDTTPSADVTATGFGVNFGISVYFDTK